MTTGFEIHESPGAVLALGDTQSVFEPKGKYAERRERLRNALSRMEGSQPFLVASCGAPPGTRGDLENWLLYNVGFSHFRTFCRNGLWLERSTEERMGTASSFRHWWSYANTASLPELPPARSVASLMVDSSVWPASAAGWWALATSTCWHIDGPATGPLALDIKVSHPRSLLGILKPMIDGLLSALHGLPGEPEASLVARVVGVTGLFEADVVRRLLNAESCVLGRKRFVWAFREGLQWSPDDDRLRVIRVTRQPTGTPLIADVRLSRLTP